MDSEVSNGSGLKDVHVADLLVFGFLQSCSSNSFQTELEALGRALPVRDCLWEDFEDELQTDGSRASRFHAQRIEADSESEEDLIQNLARQLAQIGDSMEHSIPPGLVHRLAEQLVNPDLVEEDRRGHVATALEQLMQTCPADLEQEKATLVLTMLLAKKVADHTPSLLRDVFRTTVNFINQNLLTYVRNLARNFISFMLKTRCPQRAARPTAASLGSALSRARGPGRKPLGGPGQASSGRCHLPWHTNQWTEWMTAKVRPATAWCGVVVHLPPVQTERWLYTQSSWRRQALDNSYLFLTILNDVLSW
ncbi:BH3-interacting domain death agonist isoform X1 [Microcebus murinus]|uniref:BH3-interacting domain death agonist isoform X1 n=1 Tax=Microcebus murinus TaxID=30608 RepID=UPI003F6D537B